MISLAERLAALRANTNTSTKSASKLSTPLATYLKLYGKAGLDRVSGGSCYVNYMQGAKLLLTWLSPISIPEIDKALLPKKVPSWFHHYELQQISALLVPTVNTVPSNEELSAALRSRAYVERVICYLIAKEILNAC